MLVGSFGSSFFFSALVFSVRSLAFRLGIFGLSVLEDGFSPVLGGSAAFVFLPRGLRLVGISFGL